MSVIIVNKSVLARLTLPAKESGMSHKEFAQTFKLTQAAMTELPSGRTKIKGRTVK